MMDQNLTPAAAGAAEEGAGASPVGPAEPSQPSFWQRLTTAPALKKSLSEYRAHPLNKSGSDAVGQVIRGVEGLLGGLDLAVIDLLVGLVNLFAEWAAKKAAPAGGQAAPQS